MKTAAKRVVVLCDGTWAGSETRTETNIFLLAKMMGLDRECYLNSTPGDPIPFAARGINGCYFPGAGLGGTFLEYILNGATGDDIDDNCLKVYKYIVQHYTPQTPQSPQPETRMFDFSRGASQTPQPEIWMFGFSRGAYTVRCVAGMIYNCGILKRRKNGQAVLANDNTKLTNEEEVLCEHVYWIYRSNDPADHPESPRSTTFRARASHDVRTPVKFMGLFDAVGGLGIPFLNPGIGLSFYEFHDTKVSSVVEKVYHALCIHERLWGLEPYHVSPASIESDHSLKFMSVGSLVATTISAAICFSFFDLEDSLTATIKPNLVFADLALKWMLESIQEHSGDELIWNIDAKIKELVTNMESADDTHTGNGDIYSNIIHYVPLGSLWETLYKTLKHFEKSKSNVGNDVINAVSALKPITQPVWMLARLNFHVFHFITRQFRLNTLPFAGSALQIINEIFRHDPFSEDAQKILTVLGIMLSSQFLLHEFRTILDVLAHTKERRISDVNASVVRYDEEMLGDRTIMEAGRIKRPEGAYQSQTYENFRTIQQIM
ncbi:hypothetical protein BG006_002287 [Podila minutissima]|uniref:T6SS Phospholipase effector Tle1-like catalytic domain-containing protein n=1 Tax=Podila minutissima TaxID=64525 RepID=A0A9P5SCX5_9FUNG|nr:hypothetical protein BG006_002287 [Podila minutissima]